jgi:hypothetical protein
MRLRYVVRQECRAKHDRIEQKETSGDRGFNIRQRSSLVPSVSVLFAGEQPDRQILFELHQNFELGAIEFPVGGKQCGPGEADDRAGGRDRPKPYCFLAGADGDLVRLEIAVKSNDCAVHAQHPRIRLRAPVADLLGCGKVEFKERELGVLGIGRETVPFCRRPVLDEFYRVAFRKRLYASIEDLQNDLDLWIRSYNEERPHH